MATLFDVKHHNYHIFSNDMINMELQKCSHWFMSNKLSLNILKSNNKSFLTNHTSASEYQNIGCVDEFNYLGIMLNKYLNWKQFIAKIANKLYKAIGCDAMWSKKKYIYTNYSKFCSVIRLVMRGKSLFK